MTASLAHLTDALHSRFGAEFGWRQKTAPEVICTGIAAVDALTGGLPRGCLTEICGPASSGRTSLLASILAQATTNEEVCAVIDASDALDPAGLQAAGVELNRLLWVRCGNYAEHALQATDLLLQGGGFGVAVMDLSDIPPQTARRISLTSWFRLRRAVENTPTVLMVMEQEPHAGACASLSLQMRREKVLWSGTPGCSHLLRGIRVEVERRKPACSAKVTWIHQSCWGGFARSCLAKRFCFGR